MAKVKNNSDKSILQFNLKSIVIFLIIAVGIYFLLPKLISEKQAFSVILKVNKWYLIPALAAELISYIGAAGLMGVILSRIGYNIPFKDRFRLGSIAAFAIHFFPVSGLGEGAVDYYFLKKRNVNTGSIFLMFILRIIISYTAFLILFVVSLLAVPTLPDIGFSPKVISFILFILVFSGAFYLIILYRNRENFYKFILSFSKLVNRILRLLKRREIAESKIKTVYNDIYEGIGLFSHKKRSSLKAIATGLIYWLGDMTCLYFVFLSFGYQINIGALIFGYCLATLAGQLSLIPGGLGVTEGSMSLIYSAVGIPISLAITAVLIFRLFSFWIWIPVGLLSYITLKKENGNHIGN